MSLQLLGIIIFFLIVLPVSIAWHAFVSRYFLASLIAAVDIVLLLLLLMIISGHGVHFAGYMGGILLIAFVVALLAALLVGLPFLLIRRKGKRQEAVS